MCGLLVFLILYNLSLFGEIIDVQVLFNPAFCKSSCSEKLQKLFENIPAVDSVEIHPTQGSAQLKWKKGAPYDFSVIKRVMQHTGAGISYMRITARGEIQSDKKNYYLVSCLYYYASKELDSIAKVEYKKSLKSK